MQKPLNNIEIIKKQRNKSLEILRNQRIPKPQLRKGRRRLRPTNFGEAAVSFFAFEDLTDQMFVFFFSMVYHGLSMVFLGYL